MWLEPIGALGALELRLRLARRSNEGPGGVNEVSMVATGMRRRIKQEFEITSSSLGLEQSA